MIIILQNLAELHFHLFLQKGFYRLSVNLPCQKNLSWTSVLLFFPFFLMHCWLGELLLLTISLATLHGVVFALSSLIPDRLLFRSHRAISANGPTSWFCTYSGFPGIHLSIPPSAFSLSYSPLLESYFIQVLYMAFLANHCVKPKLLFPPL